MKGYVGVTSREFFMYLANENYIGEVNFWRKDKKNFKVLTKGEPFFFIVKNEKSVKGERALLGMATYERFEVLTVNDAWNKYEQGNGNKDKQSFIEKINTMYEIDINSGQIGCIILSDFKVFNKPVFLSEFGIEFENNIVSGSSKQIGDKEIALIIEHGFSSTKTKMSQLHEGNQIDYTEDDEGFPEGKLKLKQHLAKERNSKVVKLAKARYLKKHNKLICQVCEFDFVDRYGDLGEGYIEGHHTKPISEMVENETTKVKDIALVCANCHRMLHRKRPWLTINELKEILVRK